MFEVITMLTLPVIYCAYRNTRGLGSITVHIRFPASVGTKSSHGLLGFQLAKAVDRWSVKSVESVAALDSVA